MRFLVDAQLPPALARWLSGKGHEAEHVADRQMEAASDTAIWDFALRASAAIITKDEDFAQRKVLTEKGPVAAKRSLAPLPNRATPISGDSWCWARRLC
jgi:predicted nuclease of predicted toxin-antitoxin system